jgi:hypothetical protein
VSQAPADIGRAEVSSLVAGYDRLFTELGAIYQLSIAERLRLEELKAVFVLRGLEPTDPAVARWLSPVICITPNGQADFLKSFGRAAEAAPPPAVGPSAWFPEAATTLTRGLRKLQLRLRSSRPRVPSLSALSADAIVAGQAGLVLLLIVWAAAIALSSPADTLLHVPEALRRVLHVEPPPPTSVEWRWVLRLQVTLIGLFLAVAAFLLLTFAMGSSLLRRSRRRRMEFNDKIRPEAARPVALQVGVEAYFAEPRVVRSIMALGRHHTSPGLRLHVRRSLRATLKKGGFPVLRYGLRPRVPEYVLLVDREGPRDHLYLVGEILARRMDQHRVTVFRYHFDRTSAHLRPIDAGERPTSLLEVQAANPGARWLIVAEPDRLLSRPGMVSPWLAALAAGASVTILNPRRESDWERDEADLRRVGVSVLPATPDGVARYSEWLTSDAPIAPGANHLPASQLDTPFHLGRLRARLFSPKPLEAEEFAGLEDDLTRWLGSDLMRLLRALAVFPRLEPALTLALGRALKGADGSPLLNDDTLLRLIRLPWLRAGRMPGPLRGELARGLGRADLAATVRTIEAFLRAEVEALRTGRMPPARERDLLIHWLSSTVGSDLHDDILIDAIRGRAPAELGAPSAPSLRDRVRTIAEHPATPGVLVGLLGASLAVWVQPDVRQSLPDVRQSLPDKMPAQAEPRSVAPASNLPAVDDVSAKPRPAPDALPIPKASAAPSYSANEQRRPESPRSDKADVNSIQHITMGPLEMGTNRQGYDFDAFGKGAPNVELCAEMCRVEPDCKAVTYVISLKTCWMKNHVPPATSNPDMISSVKAMPVS